MTEKFLCSYTIRAMLLQSSSKSVIVRVQLVHLVNVDHCQAAADSDAKSADLAVRLLFIIIT